MPGFVELYCLGKTYPSPRGPVEIVRDVTLNIAEGEFIALIGHSGCGKSTILNMLAGLQSPSTGSIVVAHREIDGPGPDRGVVFQSPSLLPWLTAAENVRLGIDQVFPRLTRAQRHSLAVDHLARVGLEAEAMRLASDLSQGMQQRVGIARALAISPKVLLLDEPFGMVDSLTRIELQDMLLELLSRDRKTSVLVTHDVDEAILLADRIVMLTNGPSATIGRIATVPFPRPRDRATVLSAPHYYELRESILAFLEDPRAPSTVPPAAPSPDAVAPASPAVDKAFPTLVQPA